MSTSSNPVKLNELCQTVVVTLTVDE